LRDLRSVFQVTSYNICDKSYFIIAIANQLLKGVDDLPERFISYGVKISTGLLAGVEKYSSHYTASELEFFERYFKKAEVCFDCILVGGWIKPEAEGYFEATVPGNSLRMMSLMKRKSRQQAQKEMDGFLLRIEEFNSLGVGFEIHSAYVFGSYLTDSDSLGDLDIALEYGSPVDYSLEDGFLPKTPFARYLAPLLSAGYKEGGDWLAFLNRYIIRFVRKGRFVTIFHLDDLLEYVRDGTANAEKIYLKENIPSSPERSQLEICIRRGKNKLQ
jgi:hypothetical protein